MKYSIVFLLLCFVGRLSAQVAEIPFEYIKGITLIKVKVNNDPTPRTFVFDTGATSDVIDIALAKVIGLEKAYKQSITGASGESSYQIIPNQKIEIADKIQIKNTNLIVSDLTDLKERLQRDFDGIVGYNLLSNFVTQLDFEKQKILIYKRIDELNTSGYETIPFTFDNGIEIPQFNIDINLKNGESFSGKVLFDSGAGLSLVVNAPYNKRYKLNEKAEKSLKKANESLNGKSFVEEIAIESMQVGKFELGEMAISISHDKAGVSAYGGYLGILGGKIISRFHVILDYPSRKLYLKPNASFDEPFEFPLHSFELEEQRGSIVVRTVGESSLEYSKGLRQGDELLSINKRSIGDIEAYREVLSQEGEIVNLTFLKASGKVLEIQLELKKVL